MLAIILQEDKLDFLACQPMQAKKIAHAVRKHSKEYHEKTFVVPGLSFHNFEGLKKSKRVI